MSNLESLSHSVAIYALSEVEERIASFSWSLTMITTENCHTP